MSNVFRIETSQVNSPARKSRYTEANTRQRIKQFLEPSLADDPNAGPRLNDGNTDVEVMAFEGSTPQDARVTSNGGSFDRVEIWARNEDFVSDRPIYLRVRRGGVVLYAHQLKVSDFVPDPGQNFKKKQIKIGQIVEDNGENWDIDLEQDELGKIDEQDVCFKEITLGNETVSVLAEVEAGQTPDATLRSKGTKQQVSSGRFVVAEIKLVGEARTAVELRRDERSGNYEDLAGEPYTVPHGAQVRTSLPTTEKSYNRWYEKKNQIGYFIEEASGIPNVDPFAPEGIARVNHPQE